MASIPHLVDSFWTSVQLSATESFSSESSCKGHRAPRSESVPRLVILPLERLKNLLVARLCPLLAPFGLRLVGRLSHMASAHLKKAFREPHGLGVACARASKLCQTLEHPAAPPIASQAPFLAAWRSWSWR